MGSIVHLYLLTVLSCCGTQGLALVIVNGPINVTVCSGTNATISCGFTGVSDPWSTLPDWRIIKRNNNGYVISNETVRVMDINANRNDGLVYFIIENNSNGIISANGSYLSVGPVDDSYNNTSYQCIFTINDIIIESDTAGTVTVIGPPALTANIMKNVTNALIVVQWDAVNDFLPTTYIVTWTDDRDLYGVTAVVEQTSCTITGLTLDTVYTITVTAANRCGSGPEFSTSVSLSTDTTSTTSTISPTVTTSTNTVIITSTANPSNYSNPSTTTTMTTNLITTIANGNTDNSASRNYDTSITTTTNSTIATNISMSSTNTPTTDEASDSSSNVGIIAGAAAAVGGIIMAITIVLIIFIVCYLGRRKNAKKNIYNDFAGDGTVNETSVPNPLDTNHQLTKPESSQQPEVLHMTSDIVNKEPPHPYISLEELRPQKKTETQHQQTMEYAVIDNGKKKEQEHHNRETDTQLQQPMEYAVTVVDNSEKKNKKGDEQQSGGTDAQHQPIEYAVVDKSKKKNRKKEQQNADQEPSDVPTMNTSDSANQNKNNPLLHYAELDTLPAPTENFINEDNSCTPYALVS